MSYKDKSWQEIFVKEIEQLNNAEVKVILEAVFAKVKDCHKEVPASSTGKYHPIISLGDGGLVRHSKYVFWIALELLRATPDLENEKDEILGAALLHDMCKYPDGDPNSYTSFLHPTLISNLIKETCPTSKTAETMARLVSTHMGIWDTDRRTGDKNPRPSNFDEWILHYADLMASRPWLCPYFDDNGDLSTEPLGDRAEIIKESKAKHSK